MLKRKESFSNHVDFIFTFFYRGYLIALIALMLPFNCESKKRIIKEKATRQGSLLCYKFLTLFRVSSLVIQFGIGL